MDRAAFAGFSRAPSNQDGLLVPHCQKAVEALDVEVILFRTRGLETARMQSGALMNDDASQHTLKHHAELPCAQEKYGPDTAGRENAGALPCCRRSCPMKIGRVLPNYQ